MAYGRCGVGSGGLQIGDVTTKDKSADARFLVCDGSEFSDATYPKLAEVLVPDSSTTWTASSLGGSYTSSIIEGVRNGNTIVLIRSTTGYSLLYSTNNGSTWAYKSIPSGGSASGICVYNGVFYLSDSSSIYKATAPSGTWSSVFSGSSTLGKMAASSSVILCGQGTYVRRSADNGSSWVQYNANGNAGDIAYGNGVFVHTGANKLYYSTDGGMSFVLATDAVTLNYSYMGLDFVGSKFIAYNTSASYGTNFYISTDGATWTTVTGLSYAITGVVYVNGLYIFSTSDGLYSTSNFVDFAKLEINTTVTSPTLYVDTANGDAVAYALVSSQAKVGTFAFERKYTLPSLTGKFISTPYIKAK